MATQNQDRDPRNTISPTRVVPQGHGGFAAEPEVAQQVSVLQGLVANAGLSPHTPIRLSEIASEERVTFNGELNILLERANISQASQTEGPNGNRANVTVAQPATQNTAPTPGS